MSARATWNQHAQSFENVPPNAHIIINHAEQTYAPIDDTNVNDVQIIVK